MTNDTVKLVISLLFCLCFHGYTHLYAQHKDAAPTDSTTLDSATQHISHPDTAKKKRNWIGRTANKIFGNEHPPGKPHLLVYPVIGYAPETSLEIGASALGLFYAKNDYINNRLSEVKLFSFFTTEKQYGIWIEHGIYGNRDNWFFLGAIKQQHFPLFYYGIGNESPEENPILIDADYTLVKERILKRVANNFFIGLEIDYQRLYNAEFERQAMPEPRGFEGSLNLGLGLGFVYDSRKNVLNERNGFFAELAFLDYNDNWGSDYNFRGIYWDTRKFFAMGPKRRQVLAFQAAGTFVSGDVPFNQLALLGGEVLMRGYYLGRFRDKNYVAAQAEYRFLPLPLSFTNRIGAAAFVSAGMVAENANDFQLSKFLPAGGVGLRILLFPKKDIYLRADIAFTQEGSGIYFFTGEAF